MWASRSKWPKPPTPSTPTPTRSPLEPGSPSSRGRRGQGVTNPLPLPHDAEVPCSQGHVLQERHNSGKTRTAIPEVKRFVLRLSNCDHVAPPPPPPVPIRHRRSRRRGPSDRGLGVGGYATGIVLPPTRAGGWPGGWAVQRVISGSKGWHCADPRPSRTPPKTRRNFVSFA